MNNDKAKTVPYKTKNLQAKRKITVQNKESSNETKDDHAKKERQNLKRNPIIRI